MAIQTIYADIKGITPLLQHRFPNPKDVLAKKGKKADNRTEWEVAVDAVHFTEKGLVYIPAEALEKCIHSGAKRIMKKGKTTWHRTFESGIIVEPAQPLLVINQNKVAKKNIKRDMVIDGRKAINPNTRSPVWTVRAKFQEWRCVFDVKMLNPEIPLEVLKEALTLAGLYDGLGAFRSSPRFGRFEVVLVEEKMKS